VTNGTSRLDLTPFSLGRFQKELRDTP